MLASELLCDAFTVNEVKPHHQGAVECLENNITHTETNKFDCP